MGSASASGMIGLGIAGMVTPKDAPVRSLSKSWLFGPEMGGGVSLGSIGSRIHLPRTRFDYAAEVGDGTGSNVLMSAILWIQRQFPQAPMEVTRGSGTETESVPAHDLAELVARPNPYYSGSDLWKATIFSYVWRDAYWIKLRRPGRLPWNEDVAGPVEQLWYVPHWLMEAEGSDAEFITHYLYTTGKSAPVKVARENVVHFRNGIDPADPRHGLSTLWAVLREVFTDDEAANFAAALCRSQGVPGLIISPDSENAVIEDPDAVKQDIRQRTIGDRRGEAIVMTGPTKIQQFGFDPKSMDLGSIRDIPEERVCAALGIPASVVGFGTGLQQTKVGATMTEQRRMAWEDCIIPMQAAFASQVKMSLVPEFEAKPKLFGVRFDVSGVPALRENQNDVVERADIAIKGGWGKVSDGRRAAGWEVTPADDVYLRSLMTIEVPAGKPRPSAPSDPKRRKSAAEQRILARARDGARTAEQRDLMARMFRDAAIEVLAPKSAIEDEADARAVLEAVDIDAVKRALGRITGAHYVAVAKSVHAALTEVMGLAVDLPDPVAAKLIAEGGRRIGLIDLEKQTLDRLFREISEGREEGLGPIEITRSIRDLVPAGPWGDARTRAKVIARTETLHAQRYSQLEAYRAAESVSSVMVFDNRTGYGDEECAALDGKIVTFDDADALMNDEHPNGTRSFAPVVE